MAAVHGLAALHPRAVLPRLAGWRGDVLLYCVSAVLAAGLAAVTVYHSHRVWGLVSAPVYALAATVSFTGRRGLDHRRRMRVAVAAAAFSALLPLAVLMVHRMHGVAWSAQPEVEVVERMARLLLDTGTPYAAVEGLVRFQDYTPYLPAMAAFGLPRAVLGDHPLTDARLVFLTAAALLVLAVLAARRRPRGGLPAGGRPVPRVPVRAVQLAVTLPATTLTVATGGDDLPVLALLVVCFAAAQHGRTVRAGVAGGLALAMKLTAAPVLLVLAVALPGSSPRRPRWRRLAVFAGTVLTVATALVLPAALASPTALVEHVIRFPAGLTGVESPAASPLPGHLLAQTGDTGHLAALVLLALAAVAMSAWVLWLPPRGPAEAAVRAAVGLVAAMMLMPATRFGYLVYPLVLTGVAIALRSSAAHSDE